MKKLAVITSCLCIALVFFIVYSLNNNNNLLATFETLNQSYISETEDVQYNLGGILTVFESPSMKFPKEKTKPYYDKALQAKKIADTLIESIDNLKNELVKESGGFDSATGIKNKADTRISGSVLIKTGKAANLKKQMDETLKNMLGLVIEPARVALNRDIIDKRCSDNFGNTPGWEQKKFGSGIPVIAAIMSLSKIKYDLSNIEKAVIRELYVEADRGCVLRFEYNGPFVASRTGNILVLGDKFEAAIGMYTECMNSQGKAIKEIRVNGTPVPVVNTIGTYSLVTKSPGEKRYSGILKMINADSSIREFPFNGSYTVIKPSASISFDNINFIYAGVETPVTITVPLITTKIIHAGVSRGTITGSNEKYNIIVNDTGMVTVSVFTKQSDGAIMVIDSFHYHVIPLPAK